MEIQHSPGGRMPTFCYTTKLLVREEQIPILEKRFHIGQHINNVMVKEAKRRINRYKNDKRYRTIMKSCVEEKRKTTKEEKQVLKDLLCECGLSKFDFYKYIGVNQKLYKDNIALHIARSIADNVWAGVKDILFGDGEKLHFKKLREFNSIATQDQSGIRFRDNQVHWQGLILDVYIPDNPYTKECLQHNVKYCRILRWTKKGKPRYRLQLVLEGIPPHREIAPGKVGIDIGMSTIATSSKNGILLKELGEGIDKIDKQIAELQRSLDHKRRLNNPNNYNEDGTPKKGRKKWNNTKAYLRMRAQLHDAYLNRSRRLEESHNMLANEILMYGSEIYVEKMNFKGLQKRSKKTEISEKTGKYKRKKRFGKSELDHAPAAAIAAIRRKVQYHGLDIHEVDTKEVKASQFNHVTGEYKKKSLATRWTQVDENTRIQRDLYSAFLLQHVEPDLKTINVEECKEDFDDFKEMHDEYMANLESEPKVRPSSMGLNK